ncbi:phosphoribosyl 1,2-cyclic phosphate phosphodiesterase, partial [Tremellales sp. Uapishka_1]
MAPIQIHFLGTGTSSCLPITTCLTRSQPLPRVVTESIALQPTGQKGGYDPDGIYPSNVACMSCRAAVDPEAPDGWKNRRGNTSILVVKEGRTILVDAGKSFREQSQRLFPQWGIQTIDAILLTHGHADAYLGLDDLREYTRRSGTGLPIYCTSPTFEVVTKAFPYFIDKNLLSGSGYVPRFEWNIIEDDAAFDLLGIHVQCLPVHHGTYYAPPRFNPDANQSLPPRFPHFALPVPLICLGFQFDHDTVYLSDVDAIPQSTWRLIESNPRSTASSRPKVLIVDVNTPLGPNPSHFNLPKALEVVLRMDPAITFFTDFWHSETHYMWERLCQSISGDGILGPSEHPDDRAARQLISKFWSDGEVAGRLGDTLKKWKGRVEPGWDGLSLIVDEKGWREGDNLQDATLNCHVNLVLDFSRFVLFRVYQSPHLHLASTSACLVAPPLPHHEKEPDFFALYLALQSRESMTAGDHDSHQATTFEHINGEMGELQLDGHSASSSVTQAMNPLGLHLISHPSRGNGVFTATAIPANTLIEESPVLVLSKEEWDRGDMNDTILGSYGFCWRNGGMALGLGLASLFNHSSRPNVNFIRSPSSNTIIFKTSRAVQPGEELCICYSADESKLWFTPAGAGSKAQGIEDAPELPSMEAWFQNLEGDEKVDERERREERARRRDEGKMTREKEKHLKYEKKQAALAQESIFQPRPMPFGTSSEASSSTTPCSTPPTYPTLPETTMAALPVPLHSGKGKSRHEHVGPVVLTAPLDWRAEDFAGNDVGGEDDWGEVMRIKGPAEEEEEKDFAGTMFYIFPRKEGGFEANFGIHGHGGLNHRFEVWRWTGDVADDVREKLRVDDGITL